VNFTFRIYEKDLEEMNTFPDENWSDCCREALDAKKKELKRRRERRFSEAIHYRTNEYNDDKVTVNAKLGEYGPTDWSLKIQTSEMGDRAINVKLGPSPRLDRIIEGVADYYNHENLKKRRIDLSTMDKKIALANIWLEIAKISRENKLDFSANVANLPFQSIYVTGNCGRIPETGEPKQFKDHVLPKNFGKFTFEDHHFNNFSSNFYIGSYANTQGTVFRLSSYLEKQYNHVSAKTATRYIDFYPDKHKDEIIRIIKAAKVVYLPNLSIKHVKSLIF